MRPCLAPRCSSSSARWATPSVRERGETERILPNAVTERMVQHADGSLWSVTEGSTQAATLVAPLRDRSDEAI
jgi:hypothetical protein